MINTQSFVLYESVYKHIETLKNRVSESAALHYITSIMEFGLYGVLPPDDDEVWVYGFEQAKTSIYAAKERYNKSKENGKMGGAPERYTVEQVAELKEQGLTNQEIANILGCCEKTVERKNKAYRDSQRQTDKTEHNLKEKENENLNDKKTDKQNENIQNKKILNANQNDTEKKNDNRKENNLFSKYV